MPEEAKKSDAAAEKKDAGGKGLLSRTPVLLGGVMLLEAVVLFAGFKFIGGGAAPASAVELAEVAAAGGPGDANAAGMDAAQLVEVSVVDFKAPNKVSGRTLLIDVSIF